MYIFVYRRVSGKEENEEEGNLRGIYEKENSLNHSEIKFIDQEHQEQPETSVKSNKPPQGGI